MMRIKSCFGYLLLAAPALMLAAAAARAEPPFKHKPHEKIACLTCHEREDGHGRVKITVAADCTGCHHSRDQLRVCSSCHTDQKLATPQPRTISFRASTSAAPQVRTLSFEHKQHTATQCTVCHSTASQMRVVKECTSCHSEHHQERRNCTACHAGARDVAAHDTRSHASCSGAGCHADEVTAPLRTQRNVCLTCHSDLAGHEPARDCASCHMIPEREKR
jgi:hypothetical protein